MPMSTGEQNRTDNEIKTDCCWGYLVQTGGILLLFISIEEEYNREKSNSSETQNSYYIQWKWKFRTALDALQKRRLGGEQTTEYIDTIIQANDY